MKHIYLDSLYFKNSLNRYASPKSKLTTMIQSGKIIHIRRGLYIPGNDAPYSLKTLANKIYGPSYISFEYALSLYGIIPERATVVTSAVFKKNKNKKFSTPAGTFVYRCVPDDVFYLDVRRTEEDAHPFLIASMEKALCDYIYLHRYIRTISQLIYFLYQDMRMDRSILSTLDLETIQTLAPLYRKRVFFYLVQHLKKEISNA